MSNLNEINNLKLRIKLLEKEDEINALVKNKSPRKLIRSLFITSRKMQILRTCLWRKSKDNTPINQKSREKYLELKTYFIALKKAIEGIVNSSHNDFILRSLIRTHIESNLQVVDDFTRMNIVRLTGSKHEFKILKNCKMCRVATLDYNGKIASEFKISLVEIALGYKYSAGIIGPTRLRKKYETVEEIFWVFNGVEEDYLPAIQSVLGISKQEAYLATDTLSKSNSKDRI